MSDVVYRPLETELIRQAAERGHPVLDGGRMAVGQAYASLQIITGARPDRDRMERHFRALIGAEERSGDRGGLLDERPARSEVRESAMTRRRAARASAAAQEDILDVATAEFAANGYAGARVDEIAARTRTTKRMIYYYFGSKEGLYLAVLERVYAQIRRVERGIQIDELSPDEALRKLAEATYDHHTTHEAFIQLVSIENIHRAEHLRQSETILRENVTAITLLEEVIERGVREGIFRDDVDALDVHMVISAYACFHVANRHTFAAIFNRDMLDPALQDSHRRLIGDMVVATMTDRGDARGSD